jgi:hypothetical protein
LPASEDFGVHYFTSCPEVRDYFEDYTYEILSEYDSPLMAFEVEQRLIYELRHDNLLINKNYKVRGLIQLDPKPVHAEPASVSHKKRKSYLRSLPKASVVAQRRRCNSKKELEKSTRSRLTKSGFEQYISIYKKLKSGKIDSRVKKFFKKKKLDINVYINNPELLEYKS